jgi:hypothetical protein
MSYKNVLMVVSIMTIACFVMMPVLTLAATQPDPSELLQETGSEAGFEVREEGQSQLTSFVGRIINILLSILGVIFFVLLVYGGFLWMTSQGNEDKVKKAKTLITDAVIGLVIILAAYAISSFVITSLVEATID